MLRDRFKKTDGDDRDTSGHLREVTPLPENSEPERAAQPRYQELKGHIHSELIDRLDLAKLETLHPDELYSSIAPVIREVLADEGVALNRLETERITREILDETLGLGPLEPLLADPTISDILVNGPQALFIERGGVIEPSDVVFKDDQHLLKIIDRILTRIGRRVDESNPMVDARLADGSRVNVIIPPLALDGPTVSIRKFKRDTLSVQDMMRFGTINASIANFLEGCVRAKLNILISGGTGSGKTTMLNVMSRWIPRRERVVTIEDAAELQLQQPHVVRLETRPPNVEGKGRVVQRDLLINSLRMRPDRIIIGEVRGSEALDMLQAMNTGHEGSMTTIHANGTRDAFRRLESMVQLAGLTLSTKAIREQVASALDVVIQLQRLPDGTRRMVEVAEVTGMESDVITLQTIFQWEQQGVDADGRFRGELKASGIRPSCAARIERYGHHLPEDLFEEEDDR